MSALFQWITNNKEWLFSGAGISIIGLGYFVFKKINTKKRPMEEPSSENSVVGDNIVTIIGGQNTLMVVKANDKTETKKSIIEDDSAYQNNRPPENKLNRFYFATSTDFSLSLKGRKAEIKQLSDFCRHNPKMPFLWWMITGEGGTGKSKLCYEFSKIKQNEGWTICYPEAHDLEHLTKCSNRLTRNTLFILDYSEYNTRDIFNWMSRLGSDKYKKIDIRILLIQRTGMSVGDIEILFNKAKPGTFLKDHAYNNGIFLRLESPKKPHILNIQREYASSIRNITDFECEIIYNKLSNIDEKFLRPLYAIILTDAYLDDSENIFNWTKKEDILNYICKNEVRKIIDSTNTQLGYVDKYLGKYGIEIFAMATMVRGLEVEYELKHLLPHIYLYLEKHPYKKNDFFNVPVLFSDVGESIACSPLEPDIVGEYFILFFLNGLNKNECRKMIKAAWLKPYFMSRFVSRLYQDFEELIVTYPYYVFLKNIEISYSISYIASDTFQNCTAIESVNLPSSIVSIGYGAFERCTNLKTIELPNSITKIGGSAFYQCINIETIKLPNNITVIAENTFSGCKKLKSIEIPESVIMISDGAFVDCESLESIYAPSVIDIGLAAFSGCKRLKSIRVSDKLTGIADYAFDGCASLEVMKISDYVEYIGVGAFRGCINLRAIELPDAVKDIGKLAFAQCTSLETIRIPPTITGIDTGAFRGCNNPKLLQQLKIFCTEADIEFDVLFDPDPWQLL